ncbi:MAG: hypothetical protein IBJ10_07750 [Phycisphaerales bacterium]|nr:hypothetical protein [Phycisphaerales bacterium]
MTDILEYGIRGVHRDANRRRNSEYSASVKVRPHSGQVWTVRRDVGLRRSAKTYRQLGQRSDTAPMRRRSAMALANIKHPIPQSNPKKKAAPLKIGNTLIFRSSGKR